MADATASTATPPENKPQPTPTKRWADEEDDPAEESTVSSSGLELENLKIDENKKINKFLDDPEDSKIKAV